MTTGATSWNPPTSICGGRGVLDSVAAEAAAEELARYFLHDLVEALKSDRATSGEAFASVVLRFLSTILFSIRDLSAKVDESLALTPDAVADLKRALQAGADASRLLKCEDLQPLFDQLERIEARFDDLDRGLKNHLDRGVHQILSSPRLQWADITLTPISAALPHRITYAEPDCPRCCP